jgi:hypothetical protein
MTRRLAAWHFVIACLIAGAPVFAGDAADPVAAAAYRRDGPPVEPISDSTLICEAEEFRVLTPGWKAQPWGANYYAATMANTFLSRKAFLGAPEQCDESKAEIDVRVPAAGRYLALIRYEAAYRFETQFRLKVEQAGRVKLDRLYGARDNVKICAFRHGVRKDATWDWGATDNIVWEGHDTRVDFDAGPARLTLVAGRQPANAARRNVDVVMLTRDEAQVRRRIETENYLPLDGMLTQAGDLFLKLHNAPVGAAMTLTVPNGTEHSPYWVHRRDWQPKTLSARPGASTDWVEVGSLLDTLNDGQWNLTPKGAGRVHYSLEFGVPSSRDRQGAENIETIRRLDNLTGTVTLAYHADTRYSRRISTPGDILAALVADLRQQPVHGRRPTRTLIYGTTFPRPERRDDGSVEKYNADHKEFIDLSGATALATGPRDDVSTKGPIRGVIDIRSTPSAKLEAVCQKLQSEGKAERIAVVSQGDEIGLDKPPADDHAGFRAWLKETGRRPADLDPAWGDDWDRVRYSASRKHVRPELYYYSQLYAYRYGIRRLNERTDILRRRLPNAGIGANFSPHHGAHYLGTTHQWVSLFREGGLTMPWGEDYIWQVPVGTQQMNFLVPDMFRAGIRDQPGAKIQYYVMPHTPGNTPASWRRQFYGDIAHGVTIFNLFEYRPVQVAYTENHTSDPAMYREVRRALFELGTFEDVVQDGRVRPAEAGLWFSEAADVWDDNSAPFAAGKRTLYIAIRHRQHPLDVVVEGDDLSRFRVLYITDRHVSRAATRAIADWVHAGGRLLATAGAGMFDEFDRPNTIMRELLGVEPAELELSREPIKFEKQDLPFAEPLAVLMKRLDGSEMPVFGARSRLTIRGATMVRQFTDGLPAVTEKQHGRGKAVYCGFLPGLSYFRPSLPRRPIDRGTTDDAFAHFVPTAFEADAADLIAASAVNVRRPLVCSEPLVETTVLEAPSGTVIPLVNWSGRPIRSLTVTVPIRIPAREVSLASGGAVRRNGDTFTLDLDVADALILR